jgi:hypothetical protein
MTIMNTDPGRDWAGSELARQLQVKPRNMLTQLAEWARLGFLTRPGKAPTHSTHRQPIHPRHPRPTLNFVALTAQRLGLDTADSAEIIERRGGLDELLCKIAVIARTSRARSDSVQRRTAVLHGCGTVVLTCSEAGRAVSLTFFASRGSAAL